MKNSSHSDERECDFPQRALAQAGYFRLEQPAEVSEAELLALHGMGPRAREHIRYALAAKRLSFAGIQNKKN